MVRLYRGRKIMKSKPYPFYLIIPALALYLTFSVIPSVMGFFYSFTDWNSFSIKNHKFVLYLLNISLT